MKTLTQTYHIHAPIKKVWHALTSSTDIVRWGGGPAKMNGKKGTEFSLWGGDIHGKNILVVPEKKLVQEWFGGDWDEASLVTFTLHEKGEETQVDLLHEKIPNAEADSIDDGWKEYYLGPLQDFVEQQ